jgi:hypothetical protein
MKYKIYLAFLGIGFALVMIFGVIQIIKVENSKPIETKITYSVIDSVWTKKPGEINTMQTDFLYFGRTEDGIIHRSTSRKFNVGDSIQYIYHRYENPKTKKK